MIDTVPLQEIRCLAHIGSRETDSGDIGERRGLSRQVARDPAAIDHPDLAGREPEEKAVPGLQLDTETAAKTAGEICGIDDRDGQHLETGDTIGMGGEAGLPQEIRRSMTDGEEMPLGQELLREIDDLEPGELGLSPLLDRPLQDPRLGGLEAGPEQGAGRGRCVFRAEGDEMEPS